MISLPFESEPFIWLSLITWNPRFGTKRTVILHVFHKSTSVFTVINEGLANKGQWNIFYLYSNKKYHNGKNEQSGGFRSSRLWRYVVRQMVADEWKERTAFVFLVWFITEHEGTMFLRNVGNHTPHYTASQPRRPESSTTQLWDTQNSKQQGPLDIRFTAQQPLDGQGFLIIEASRSHSIGHTTLGRTPLDESSARSRDLSLTTRNTRKRQISMPPAGFETAIPASKRRQTHRAANVIGCPLNIRLLKQLRKKVLSLTLLWYSIW
jgi:hypothetical protein